VSLDRPHVQIPSQWKRKHGKGKRVIASNKRDFGGNRKPCEVTVRGRERKGTGWDINALIIHNLMMK